MALNDDATAQTVLLSDLPDRPLIATFEQLHASPGGGAIVLNAADRQQGLLATLTATVPDALASGRVTHGVGDLLAQRVFAIACGRPDGNDADRLADDPIHTLLPGRDPTAGAFVLFQELQLRADRTTLRGTQVPRLRQALITIGVQVVRSVRWIVLHFPRSHPDAASWARLARAPGAAPV